MINAMDIIKLDENMGFIQLISAFVYLLMQIKFLNGNTKYLKVKKILRNNSHILQLVQNFKWAIAAEVIGNIGIIIAY